jgi:hypothetical protein
MPQKINFSQEQKEKIIEMVNKKEKLSLISKEIGVSIARIQKELPLLNVTYRPLNNKIEEIIKLYKEGKTTREIGKIFNCYNSTICDHLHKHKIKMRTNEDRRIYEIDETYFHEINSHEKAAILGFFFADGCNMSPKFRIGIHKKDIDFLQKVSNILQPNKPNSIRFTYNGSYSHTNRQDKDIAYLTLYSKKICQDLDKIGCNPRKSLTAIFPNITPEFYSSFLCGYNDGDGHITFSIKRGENKRSYATGFICSKNFAIEAQKIIIKYTKINCQISQQGKIYHLRIGGNKQVEKFLDWIYQNSAVKLNRKYKKYLEMKQYFRRYNEQKYGKKEILPLP